MIENVKKLFNFRPALIFAISLSFGILTAYLYLFDNVLCYFVGIGYVILLAVCFILRNPKKLKRNLLYALIFILVFLCGSTVFFLSVNSFDNADLYDHYYTVEGRIKEFSDTDYGTEFILENVNLKGVKQGSTDYRVSVFVNGKTDYDVGDVISVYGVLYDKTYIYEGRFAANNVESRLKYSMSVEVSDIKYVKTDVSAFQKVNLFIRESLKRGLSDDEFTVAYALLTGNSEYMSEETVTSYRNAGVAHIFAVSGLHIGFVAFTISFLLKKLKCKGIIPTLFTIAVLIFYSGVCGFSASSVRAAVMCSVALFATLGGMRYDGLSAIGVAASVVLLYSPVSLFCVGFQLSFCVVIAVILTAKPVGKLFKFLPDKLAISLGTVISAQLASIPIFLYAFNRVSLIAVMANLIFLPVVGILFVLLVMCTVFGGLFYVSEYLLFPIKYILTAVNFAIKILDDGALIVGGFSLGIFTVFYYACMVLCGGLINVKASFCRLLVIVFSVICVVGTMCVNIVENDRIKCIVIGSELFSATVIISPDDTALIINECQNYFSVNRLSRVSYRYGIDEFDKVFITKGVPDTQSALTRISKEVSFTNVFIFGKYDETEEKVLKKSFGVSVRYLADGDGVSENGLDYEFGLSGYALLFEYENYRAVFFSKFGDKYSGYTGLKDKFDLVVAYDYAENIFECYKPIKRVCFRRQNAYLDGEKNGNLIFYIN